VILHHSCTQQFLTPVHVRVRSPPFATHPQHTRPPAPHDTRNATHTPTRNTRTALDTRAALSTRHASRGHGPWTTATAPGRQRLGFLAFAGAAVFAVKRMQSAPLAVCMFSLPFYIWGMRQVGRRRACGFVSSRLPPPGTWHTPCFRTLVLEPLY
jgi:hypothetical protein